MLKNYKNLGMVVKKLQKKRFTLACLGTMLEQIIHYFKFKLSNTYRCIAYITLQIRIDQEETARKEKKKPSPT